MGSADFFLATGRIGGTLRVIIGDCGMPDNGSGTAGLGVGRPAFFPGGKSECMEELVKPPLPDDGGAAGLCED